MIIGGDFNDEHAEGTKMTAAMEKLGMVNITSPPRETTPPTYSRGKRTLDHIWVTGGLVSSVVGYGYLPFELGFDSDHRGAFVDIRCSTVDNPGTPERNQRKLNW